MDPEKSSNSSFEDLSNFRETDKESSSTSESLLNSNSTVIEDIIEKETDKSSDNVEVDAEDDDDDDENHIRLVSDGELCDILGNGQLMKRVIQKALVNKRPVRGDLVTISYTGKLTDGQIVENEENLQIHVGDSEVVQGLDIVLPIMSIGEIAEITVSPRFAYGSLGLKNDNKPEMNVPPKAEIIYSLHLIDVKPEDMAELRKFETRLYFGTRKKERANFWYNRSEFAIAIQLYRRALDYLDDRVGDPDADLTNEDIELSNKDLQTLLDNRLIVYNNLAMAQIKISAFDAALQSVENVLRCQPNNSKALYRKGRILDGKGDTKGAISLLQKAASLEPESRTIQQDLSKLIIKSRREEHNEKEMYQKMLGHAKKLEQKNKETNKIQSTENSKLKLLGFLMGSILVGVAGVAFYRYKF